MKPDRPIRIVRLIDRLNVGGPARHAAITSKGLSEEATGGRFDTLLVHGRVAAGEEEMQGLFDEGPAVRRVFIGSFSRKISPFADLWAFLRICRLLLRERPQVVHTHKSKAGVLGRIAAWLLRVPVRVHTFHGHVFEGYFSGGASKTILRIERVLGRITHAILAVSPALRQEFIETYRLAPAEKIRVVPLGLELAGLNAPKERRRLQRELGIDPARPAVGIVGRLAPIKNHGLFLRAAATLAGEREDVVFFIVGGGELERSLKQRAKALGLGSRVFFTGNRSDLPEVLASLDALALTSHNEGTPVVVIEALAAGVPVVATRVGGVPDVLEKGRFGALVPPDDEGPLVRALAATIAQPPAEQRRSEARQAVLERYSAGRLCSNLAALYEELLGVQGNSGK